MSEVIIQTNQLTKSFGKRKAVENVNLRINKGDIYGFLGPNGAGKTTTIRMLLGLSKPTEGQVFLFGKNMKKDKITILRKVGSLVEMPSYYAHLTAYENLEAIRCLLDVPKNRIDEVLATVRLTKEAHRPVKGFSLGMKQRLGIAAALLGNPEVLILDEPTNGLDPSGILEIRELIKRLPKEHGMTILVSSHLLSEIDQMATQVGIISKGNMIFQDSIGTLRKMAQTKINITVHNPELALRTSLAHGFKVSKNDEKIILNNTSNEKVANLISTLVKSDIDVYRVEEEKKTLEEIFLELTKGASSL